MMERPQHITLAIYPDRKGFGWVAFTGPFAVFDWGLACARRNKSAVCLAKIEALLERLSPETLVLEAFERPSARRADRLIRLSRAVSALAADRGAEVAIYTRADIAACFLDVGAQTRDEIARAVVRHVDVFRHRLPKRRTIRARSRRILRFHDLPGAARRVGADHGSQTEFADHVAALAERLGMGANVREPFQRGARNAEQPDEEMLEIPAFLRRQAN